MPPLNTNPLTWSIPIADPLGRPTPEFMRKWDQQQAANAAVPVPGRPSSLAGPKVVLGNSNEYMRADSAPAVQIATTGQLGLVEPDGTTITIVNGIISSVANTPANPTAVASNVAVNGVSLHFMRADAAPAVQLATVGQFGLVKPDGTTITISGGVISSAGGGGSSLAIDWNGVLIDSAAASLNFAGPGTNTTTDGSHHATVKVVGTLPLTNGVAGPVLMDDGTGQCIAVPLQ